MLYTQLLDVDMNSALYPPFTSNVIRYFDRDRDPSSFDTTHTRHRKFRHHSDPRCNCLDVKLVKPVKVL
jgi:hypothetical protein